MLGCDFVGEVTELGSGVTRLAKGDVVAGLIWGGKYHLSQTLNLSSSNSRGNPGSGWL